MAQIIIVWPRWSDPDVYFVRRGITAKQVAFDLIRRADFEGTIDLCVEGFRIPPGDLLEVYDGQTLVVEEVDAA